MIITDIAIDKSNDIWITGQNVHKFDGKNMIEYNYLNSSTPSNDPYFLDTRTISIDPNGRKWIGCAVAPFVSQTSVFRIDDEYSKEVKKWNISDFGLSGSWDFSKIYSSPYGNESLVFATELNGGAGATSSTGPFGVTGGYVYRYSDEEIGWEEILEGFNWPHVYEIKSRGIGGDRYEYWVATHNGVVIFPGGSNLVSENLLDLGVIPGITRILNELNSPLPSSIVYSIDFDEDYNLWIGTDGGIVFLSNAGDYKVWNTDNLTGLPSNKITTVKAVTNGQVFFSCGDGSLNSGNGLFYFNGIDLKIFNSSNSSLPDNNITEIISFWRKTVNQDNSYYPGELILTTPDKFLIFDYTVPHIKASSKEAGPTGWCFVNYDPVDSIGVPRVNRYTWEYPSWRQYQNLYLENKHPGLDRRNLFLETDFSDIVDGSAGERYYWSEGPLETFEEQIESGMFKTPPWISGITGDFSFSSGVPSIKTDGNEDRVFFSLTVDTVSPHKISFGQKANGQIFQITNPNSTTQSSPGSFVGVIGSYTKMGQFEGVTSIRGNSTRITSIKSSPDGKSVYAMGFYNSEIEVGAFVYGGGTGGGLELGGPIGSPIGFSNPNTPGITGSTEEYPWILNGYTGSTASPYFPTSYTPGSGNSGLFIIELDNDLGSTTSFAEIDFTEPSDIFKKYRVKKFRYFPSSQSSIIPSSFNNLVVTDRNVRIGITFFSTSPEFYTTGGGKNNWFDNPDTPLVFGNNGGILSSGYSVYLDLDRNLNINKISRTTQTGQTRFYSFYSEPKNDVTLICGFSANSSFIFQNQTIGSSEPGGFHFYLKLDSSGNLVDNEIDKTQLSDSILSSYGSGNFYFSRTFNGPGNGEIFGISSEYSDFPRNSMVVSMDHNGRKNLVGNFPISGTGGANYNTTLDSPIVTDDHIYMIFQSTNSFLEVNNLIQKINIDGSYLSEFFTGSTGSYSEFELTTSGDNNFSFAGRNLNGSAGPDNFPVPQDSSFFVGSFDNYKKQKGKAKGMISSRAGQNPWKWVDVHTDGKNLQIPLMSTVFFVNYNSNIFGKKNYKWVLSKITGEEVLDLKNTPYFIFTFEEEGQYTLYNSVEDSMGNVYEISKPAFIEVINHTIKKEDDPQPYVVNSLDYGFSIPKINNPGRYYDFSKYLESEKNQIIKDSKSQFGSDVIIRKNPDATFRED